MFTFCGFSDRVAGFQLVKQSNVLRGAGILTYSVHSNPQTSPLSTVATLLEHHRWPPGSKRFNSARKVRAIGPFATRYLPRVSLGVMFAICNNYIVLQLFHQRRVRTPENSPWFAMTMSTVDSLLDDIFITRLFQPAASRLLFILTLLLDHAAQFFKCLSRVLEGATYRSATFLAKVDGIPLGDDTPTFRGQRRSMAGLVLLHWVAEKVEPWWALKRFVGRAMDLWKEEFGKETLKPQASSSSQRPAYARVSQTETEARHSSSQPLSRRARSVLSRELSKLWQRFSTASWQAIIYICSWWNCILLVTSLIFDAQDWAKFFWLILVIRKIPWSLIKPGTAYAQRVAILKMNQEYDEHLRREREQQPHRAAVQMQSRGGLTGGRQVYGGQYGYQTSPFDRY